HGGIAGPLARTRPQRDEECGFADAIVASLNSKRKETPVVFIDRMILLSQTCYAVRIAVDEHSRRLAELPVTELNHLGKTVELRARKRCASRDLSAQRGDVDALAADPRQAI